MGVSDSRLKDQVIFIVGAPRSGTTLATAILCSHPEVAGVISESHLFDQGVDRLFDNFEGGEWWKQYLIAYVSRGRLVDLVRDLCDGVLEEVRASTTPGAPFVVEKTPLSSPTPEAEIARKLECYPDARFVHTVRDLDEVTESVMHTPFRFGRSREECRAASERCMLAIRSALEGHERYRELPYEDLAADPVSCAVGLFEWLGIEADDEARERVRIASREPYGGFESPPGRSGNEQDGLPAAQRRAGRARRLAAAARGRVTPRLSRSSSARPAVPLAASRLSEAFRTADPEGVAASTVDDFALEVRSAAGDMHARGDDARGAVVSLGADVFRTHPVQQTWRWSVGKPATSLLLSAVDADGKGARVDLSFSFELRDGLVAKLTVISPGGPARRRPAAL